MNLLDEAETLSAKVVRGRRMKKTLKVVAGVPVRLAHAGSSAALKSSPAALALVDEYDEMLANVKGQGDPLGLVEARGETYADFVTAITSTPSRGLIETEHDPESGLTFWKIADPEAVESAIWKLWQSGTRHHFCWPCLHCDKYFVPRFEQMRWPENATPAEAAKSAQLQCPHCGGLHTDDDKQEMNAKGLYVAPGQWVEDGEVQGEPVENATVSFWASGLASPFVTWGTNPGQGVPLASVVPSPEDAADEVERVAIERALEYMALTPGTPIREIPVDTVFVGSCTNGRIEDLRAAASILEGRKVADGVRMLVVPGSVKVRLQAVAEGLDKIFTEAGAEWRQAGCSMCLAMNPDKLTPGQRSASTSNRNFEGRQGPGGRTHLVSPSMAAAAAVTGRFTDVRTLLS